MSPQDRPLVRVEIDLVESADLAIIEQVISAAGGRLIETYGRSLIAEIPGGAMGALATAPGIVAVRAGEPWDSPGRLAPDGPPEVRERLAERERRAQEADRQDQQDNNQAGD
jgi:hypothetical protein